MVTMTVQDAPVTVEATLNYLLDTGVMPSVYTGGPGSTIVRAASPSDQRRVTMHNGRLQAGGFVLDREGFRFVGLGANTELPTRWLEDGVSAEVVGARAVVLGPEPLIGAQRIVLRLRDRRLVLATDGIGPFAVVDDVDAITH